MNTLQVVAIVEDNSEFAESLASLLEDSPGLSLGQVCSSAEEFLRYLDSSETQPNIALIDLSLPGMSGQELIAELREKAPRLACVAHTVFEDSATVFEALRAGAAGYLIKGGTGPKLLESLRTLEEGGAPLTPRVARMLMERFQSPEANPLSDREQEVLLCLSQGLSYKECSQRLTLSVHTVHSHVKNIYDKLQVKSKRQAVDKAVEKGWL